MKPVARGNSTIEQLLVVNMMCRPMDPCCLEVRPKRLSHSQLPEMWQVVVGVYDNTHYNRQKGKAAYDQNTKLLVQVTK